MSLKSDIQHYFESHPNERVFLKDLAPAIGSEDERQVQSAVYQLRKTFDLEVVHQGQCWIYKPVAEVDAEYMVVLNTTAKGSKILQDSDGTIWIAKKVED